ncbi:MAG: hypothetical protein ABIK31_07730 [candidate division WOR-3 bacterium]
MSYRVNIVTLSPRERLKSKFDFSEAEIQPLIQFHKLYKPPTKSSRINSLEKFLQEMIKTYTKSCVIYSINRLIKKYNSGILSKDKLNLSYLEGIIKNVYKNKEFPQDEQVTEIPEDVCSVCGGYVNDNICTICGFEMKLND